MARGRHQNGYVIETGKKPITWTGIYYVYEGGVRKQRTKVLGKKAGMKKGTAEDLLRTIIRKTEKADGVGSPTEILKTYGDACALYLSNKILSGVWSPNNAKNISSVFKNNIVAPLGKFKPEALSTSYLQTWINGVAGGEEKGGTGKGACKDITHKAYKHAKAVFEMLLDDDVLGKNPMRKVTMPETRDRCDRVLSFEEIIMLVSELSPLDRLIFEVFLSCALRPSEVFALRKNDVLNEGALMIDEGAIPGEGLKKPKTKPSLAAVPFGDGGLAMRLEQHIENLGLNDLLFPNSDGGIMNHTNWLQRNLQAAAKRAGLTGVTHQCLRRTVATRMPKHGQPKAAQGLLRHGSVTTTLDLYTKNVDTDVAIAAESWRGELNFDGVLMGLPKTPTDVSPL